MTDTLGVAHDALHTAEYAGLPVPQTHLTWFATTPEDAERILRAFPNVEWQSVSSRSHQWLQTPASDDVRLTVFVREPEREPAPLTAAADVLARVKGEASNA